MLKYTLEASGLCAWGCSALTPLTVIETLGSNNKIHPALCPMKIMCEHFLFGTRQKTCPALSTFYNTIVPVPAENNFNVTSHLSKQASLTICLWPLYRFQCDSSRGVDGLDLHLKVWTLSYSGRERYAHWQAGQWKHQNISVTASFCFVK